MPKTREQRKRVWLGSLLKTSGGLAKGDLTKNSKGRIVSKKMSELAKKRSNLGNLLKKPGEPGPRRGKAKQKAEPKPKAGGQGPQPKPKRKRASPKKMGGKQPAFSKALGSGGKISVGNIVQGKRRRASPKIKAKKQPASKANINVIRRRSKRIRKPVKYT